MKLNAQFVHGYCFVVRQPLEPCLEFVENQDGGLLREHLDQD